MKNQFIKTVSMIIAMIMIISLVPVTASAAVKGDFDENGKITAMDARIALRIAAKLMRFEDVFIEIGDMDDDGKITAGDARTLLRISARLDSYNEAAKYDEKGYIILDDAIGRSITLYEKFMNLGQEFYDPSDTYRGYGTSFIVEGSGSSTPDSILMFYMTDRGCVYKGMYTGMTKAQVLEILGDDGDMEYDMDNMSLYTIIVDGNIVAVDFDDDIVTSILVKSQRRQITYEVLAMMGRTKDQAFPPETAAFAESKDGEITHYAFSGFDAYIFDEYDGSFIRAAVISEKNDFNFEGIHVGDNFSEVEEYADKFGYKIVANTTSMNGVSVDTGYYTVFFECNKDKITGIIVVTNGYENRM